MYFSLLGKFGGLNRSSIIQPYNLTVHNRFQQISEKPTIFISFEEYNNQLLEIDIVQVRKPYVLLYTIVVANNFITIIGSF